MREGREQFREEEFNPEQIREEIKDIKEEEMKDLKEGERVEFWPGIKLDHLEKGDLEIYHLLESENLNQSAIDDKIKLIRESIIKEKNLDKKNSRQNFIDFLSQKANSKIAEEQLSQQRQAENI